MKSAKCNVQIIARILLAIIAFGASNLLAQNSEWDDPKPDPTQGLYRQIEISGSTGKPFFDVTQELMIYDKSDLDRLTEVQKKFIEQIVEVSKINFDEEYLFMIFLTTASSDNKVELTSLLENKTTLVFQLNVETSGWIRNLAMGYYHYGFAIKKDRLETVLVERIWVEKRPYDLKSYELRKYQDELQQPIR